MTSQIHLLILGSYIKTKHHSHSQYLKMDQKVILICDIASKARQKFSKLLISPECKIYKFPVLQKTFLQIFAILQFYICGCRIRWDYALEQAVF